MSDFRIHWPRDFSGTQAKIEPISPAGVRYFGDCIGPGAVSAEFPLAALPDFTAQVGKLGLTVDVVNQQGVA